MRTLPFEAVPATPLREHFTRWLVRSLDEVGVEAGAEIGGDAPTGVAPASETAPAAAPNTKAEPRAGARAGIALADAAATMPEPRAGARGERVRRFVRRADGAVWVTKPLLRSRGWTEAAIRDFLPEPEGLKPNPRFAATGAPMQVWRPETVAAAEAGAEWQDWLERSLRRRKTTLEALAESKDPDFKVRVAVVEAAITASRKGPLAAESESEAVEL